MITTEKEYISGYILYFYLVVERADASNYDEISTLLDIILWLLYMNEILDYLIVSKCEII